MPQRCLGVSNNLVISFLRRSASGRQVLALMTLVSSIVFFQGKVWLMSYVWRLKRHEKEWNSTKKGTKSGINNYFWKDNGESILLDTNLDSCNISSSRSHGKIPDEIIKTVVVNPCRGMHNLRNGDMATHSWSTVDSWFTVDSWVWTIVFFECHSCSQMLGMFVVFYAHVVIFVRVITFIITLL